MANADDTLGKRAYQEIWQRIVHLDYPPLTTLNEKELSLNLGMGLSPVRQALRRLEYDGLVMILPRRGTLTTEIGLSSVKWELEIREELEGFAARLAAKRSSSAAHSEMLTHVGMMENLSENADEDELPTLMKFTDLDSALHRIIYRETHNPSLIPDLERHFAHALRIWHYCHRAQTFSLSRYDASIYREIVQAIRDRDGGAAEQAMRQHVHADTESALSMVRDLDL
ncbi:GntR family transcriptional regulator [Corynebacterium sp. AOP40-9SA-29]|uniref:GntR family transcriptional regulator n=1 Tax=Corynebacterium sp. AOP40-9SA-29 TaxID=3457677 RepID=UPI0040348748